jgi:hypothetical protein
LIQKVDSARAGNSGDKVIQNRIELAPPFIFQSITDGQPEVAMHLLHAASQVLPERESPEECPDFTEVRDHFVRYSLLSEIAREKCGARASPSISIGAVKKVEE